MKRTHTCGELTAKDIGREAVLTGWVHKRRDHGKLIFVDIRDRYGMTQIVFFKMKAAEELRSEYVIAVKGIVQKRPDGTENTGIPTGKVELGVSELEILNPSLTPPFELDNADGISEEVRLKYRYIDLRRPDVQKKLILRHRIIKSMRDFLDKKDFIEVETPVLTKSTPEGARDFLVPSRLDHGKFFALPQSPQLFKQLLMVSGLERYFQIAKCFRDEDLRSDRQPEFTQLDMEVSFTDEEEIFAIIEKLLFYVFKETMGLELKTPFPRMSYKETMEKYNSDKPDIRENRTGFQFLWVTSFPLFKYNEEEKKWDMEHHPFTYPLVEDINLIEKEPARVRSRAYDLVINGVEIASGSIRIHKRELQEKIFKRIGLSMEEAKERFGFLLEAFEYGAPPHGGIALGLDRLIALMAGSDTIRDVIAFPKTQKAACPLTEAPSSVDERQLKELGIKLEKDNTKSNL
ncbi:MAG: aspartate--tRNA ligase [Candidatus Omnitrophica bacterium CG12_big_fil_rev_8_21_14_0_65_42_8]|nr:MAG: aspartate--tRNA ligase [Candidatus Omnitrophica bacterium CG12_big_fil_rev_8_21_14_0_65_42_8]